MEFLIGYVVIMIGSFTIRYFALSKNSNFLHVLSVAFALGVFIATFAYIALHYFMYPFEQEVVTHGFVTGRKKTISGRNYYTEYEYNVEGVTYTGGFGQYNRYCKLYQQGDTIDITYDPKNPKESIATYQQYFYINEDKKIYWLKVKNGEGRRKRY